MKMINSFYLLTILAKKTPFTCLVGRILNTPLPIVVITSDVKTSSQHILVGLNLVFGIILILCLVHFTLIQIGLPQEEVPKILIIQLHNGRITQNIIDENESC